MIETIISTPAAATDIPTSLNIEFVFLYHVLPSLFSGGLIATAMELLFKRRYEQENIRFSSLTVKRVAILDELHGFLQEFHSAMASITKSLQLAGEPSLIEKAKIGQEKGQNLTDFFHKKKIYLDADIAELFEKLLEKYRHSWIDMTLYGLPSENHNTHNPKREEQYKSIRKASEVMKNEIGPLLDELENEFRIMLGVRTTKK